MSRELDAKILEGLGCKIEWKECVMYPDSSHIEPIDLFVDPIEEVDFDEVSDKWRKGKHPCYECDGIWKVVPFYHKDGDAFLELEKEMRKRGWYICITVSCIGDRNYIVYFSDEDFN